MAINFKISEISISKTLYSTDLMMLSKFTSNVYSSYKITVQALLDNFDSKFEKMDPVIISRQWKFNSGGLFVDNRNIESSKSVINLGYAYETFMDKLYALSSDIYERPHIPSCIGEIIFSTSLNTLDKVRGKYGKETNWEQIQGRFIMGGSSEDVGGLGGAANVSLGIRNIPNHSHILNMSSNEKTISVNEVKELQKTEVVVAAERKAEPTVSTDAKETCCIFENRNIAADFAVTADHAEEDDPTCEAELNSTGRITANAGNNNGHNNVPPFYSVYVWRRRS